MNRGVAQGSAPMEICCKLKVLGQYTAATVLILLTPYVSAQYNVQGQPTGIVAPDRYSLTCERPSYLLEDRDETNCNFW